MIKPTSSQPVKTREVQNFICDSTVWNEFEFRAGDIVIDSYLKSGTTWMQQIVSQLIFDAVPDLDVASMSPWLDRRVPSMKERLSVFEKQDHRRFIKTHLPIDALPVSPIAKYIYVARDGRDVAWSLHNYHKRANDNFYKTFNDTPGRVGPPIEVPPDAEYTYYKNWFEKDGYPFWSHWDHISGWWNAREVPNILLVHYNDLKKDLPGQIDQIASFLDIDINILNKPKILKHCSFEYMKASYKKIIPLSGALWDVEGKAFINKGTNRRWQNVLSSDESLEYEKRAVERLGQECAGWLMQGSLGA